MRKEHCLLLLWPWLSSTGKALGVCPRTPAFQTTGLYLVSEMRTGFMLPWVYLKVHFTPDVLPDLHRCLTGVKALHFLFEEKLPHQPSLGGLRVGRSFCSFLPHSSQSQNMKRLPVPGMVE